MFSLFPLAILSDIIDGLAIDWYLMVFVVKFVSYMLSVGGIGDETSLIMYWSKLYDCSLLFLSIYEGLNFNNFRCYLECG